MIIYKITNLINNKIYIGKDMKNSSTYFGSGKIIKLAIKKYGKENFKKDIIEICENKEQLNCQEIHWISFYNSTNELIGYNIALGGEGGKTTKEPWNKGLKTGKLKSEHKQKISDALTGNERTQETKVKISKAHTGKILSKSTKDKLSQLNLGKILSEETKNKMSQTRKNKKQTILICPHCNKSGGTAMHRWHFDNCPDIN